MLERRRARSAPLLLTAALAWALAWVPAATRATPLDALAVGDPIESELRLLDIQGGALGGRLLLPHLGSRPLRLYEIQGTALMEPPGDPAAAITAARIERVLGRDATPGFAPHPLHASTPRLYQRLEPGGGRLELSAGVEGVGDAFEDSSRFRDASGVHARAALALDDWLIYSHLYAGHAEDSERFADPIVSGSDFILYSEDTYLAYAAPSRKWGARFGRSRWHWGPGEEGSLIVSKTSPAMTGLSFSGGVPAWRLQGTVLNATLASSAGEQLAAHRLEWQPSDGLRLGLTEAARYRASGWEPLYAVGVIPYVLVQRMLDQDEPDSAAVHRNNVMIGVDATWRPTPGARVYGEFLADDVGTESGDNPDKFAWQLGAEGVRALGRGRMSGGVEYTRIWQYVYTSFFGREHALRGMPIGFPTGPDAARVRVRAAWDPDPAWQAFASWTHTRAGENGLGEPYVPGSPRPDPGAFAGIVERTSEVMAGLRWWPASGVDLAVAAGWARTEDAGHVAGQSRDGARGSVAVRLQR